MIIHCVKAWAEVFSLLENGKVKVPVIFHGFNKSKSLAHEIVEQGYYLSFGKALKKESIKEVVRK
jgi:TatD DNase family protein